MNDDKGDVMDGVKTLWVILNVLAFLAAFWVVFAGSTTVFQETSLWTLWLAVNSVFVVGLLFRLVSDSDDT